MKALSLHQPFASLIALKVKVIETRGWRTSYRGPLAIHAAKRMPKIDDMRVVAYDHTAWQAWFAAGLAGTPPDDHEMRPGPLGAIVAVANLVDVVPMVGRWPSASPGSADYRGDRPVLYAGDKYPLALWRHGSPIFPSETVEDQRAYGDFAPGRYAWILDDIQLISPEVRCVGRQQVWNVQPEVEAELSARLAA